MKRDGIDLHDVEDARELPADLAAVALAGDAQISGASELPGQEQQPDIDRGAEFAAMLTMGVAMLTPAMPFLPGCYTPDTCRQIGTAFAAVADKRGWDLGALQSPELALAVVSIPPTVAAIVQGRAWLADKRERAERAEKAERDLAAGVVDAG